MNADLLAAVVADPDADAPRLAYADAVEAADPARAEFIRAQVALARSADLALAVRTKALAKTHGPRWIAELPALDGVTWGSHFMRGFVADVATASPDALRRHAAALFAAAPVERLTCPGVSPATLADLLAVPELARVRGLSLPGRRDAESLGNAEARLLADCAALAGLRRLALWNHHLGEPGVQALAGSLHLGQLRSLDLTQNRVPSAGLLALAYSDSLPALTDLHLYGNRIDDVGVVVLASSSLAARLRELNVGGSAVTAVAGRVLAESPALARLRVLDLNNSSLGDAGLMALAESPHLVRLRELYLRHACIGDAGVAVLLRSPLARRLRVLDIEAAEVTGIVAWEFVRSPDLARLRKLKLWDCDNLHAPPASALKRRFGKRVEVHVEERPRRAKPRPDVATRAAFMADIRAAPDDDSPRLIYADWLHDHGDPERAEFIRVQCELARLPADDPRRDALAFREMRLSGHETRWTEEAFLDWLRHPAAECPDPYSHKVCKALARTTEVRKKWLDADAGDRLILGAEL